MASWKSILWGARESDLEHPDRIIFDLDPGPGVAWVQIVEAATKLRRLLSKLDLESFVKTTGGKGLHVVAPFVPQAAWAEAKQFSKNIAQQMAAAQPTLYTTNPSKAQRPGRIFLDYLRNDRGATTVAPYSTRAWPAAPVSLPVRWRELSSDLRFDYFNVSNVPDRLARFKSDPWKGFVELDQSLPRATTATKRAGVERNG